MRKMYEWYPWGGEFRVGDPSSSVAVVTLGDKVQLPEEKVAIWGPLKTENLGIEKVVANVVSNPNIRTLVVCGREVRGHRSGDSLLAFHRYGVDANGRIIEARGAVPYIENLPEEAVERFRDQVEIMDLIGEVDPAVIETVIDERLVLGLPSFGEPLIVVKIERERSAAVFEGAIALHSEIMLHDDLRIVGVASGSDAEASSGGDA